jgi:tetratricopeptide (TPR) repeat protein
MLAGDFKAALAGYQAANNLKPGDPTVQAKITEVNSKLDEIAAKEALDKKYEDEILAADKLLQAKDYQKAITAYQSAEAMKPGETYPQGKITEINATLAEIAAKEALDKQYADAISAADKTLQVKDYQKAITEYQAALAIKPGETYAQAKINEINKTLGDIAAKEALDKQYTETIAAADNALQAKDYKAALAGYQSAQQLKPAESYTQGKITEVNKALEEIASKEALDKQYTDAIAAADAAFQAKDYQKATTGYQSALKLKPGEQYPQTKITEVNAALAEVAKQQEIVKKYNEAIAFADKHLADKDYDNAMLEYQTANSLKPDETYPLNKIKEVEGIKEEIKKQKELDTQYNKILADADDFVKKEQYEEARASYQEAQKLKPAEEFPAKQIIEINRKLDFIALEKDKAYQIAISKADNYFSQQNYDMAKLQYDRAIELKPNELYPLDKMKVVNEEIMKKRQLVQEDYDKNIADADKFYASKIYDNAIDSYRAASVLKPEEEYPKEMVRRIMKLLSERSIVQINKEPLLIANNTTHKFDFISVPVKDRKSNYIFFRARNVSKTDYKLIISFGKDQQKNGGIVVKVPAGEDLYEFVVRISAQYKWFSEDNNWITFYPEGGDLEVSLMQISYSD